MKKKTKQSCGLGNIHTCIVQKIIVTQNWLLRNISGINPLRTNDCSRNTRVEAIRAEKFSVTDKITFIYTETWTGPVYLCPLLKVL